MTAREISKLLASKPPIIGGKGGFVVLPLAEYRKLCEAMEDALDLLDLEQARRESAGETPVAWEIAKKRLDSKAKGKSKKRKVA